jgi:transcriptional regulator with XRE-family HTH domain
MAKRAQQSHQKPRSPDAGDAAVGPRIRAARRKLDMSQTDVADRLGITFQQLQKYENGKNRVSIGRLSHIADILGLSITFLLTGKEEKRDERGYDEGNDLLKTAGALRLIKAFDRMKNRDARVALVELAESAASKR